jgi:hypothetical protein
MRVIKIQTKLYLCERHLEKLTTLPLSSHLLHFHSTTRHKNLKYSGFILQYKNLNCVYGLQHVHICAALSRAVFLNRRAAARYRALASITPVRDRFSWNLSF